MDKHITMKIMEVIELRSITLNRTTLKEKLNAIFTEIESENKVHEIKSYYRHDVDTDFRIQIFLDPNDRNAELSELGLQLVNELKNYGLVNHSLWLEDEI
jgi:hypothetical protein